MKTKETGAGMNPIVLRNLLWWVRTQKDCISHIIAERLQTQKRDENDLSLEVLRDEHQRWESLEQVLKDAISRS
jgi:hypothetical protein